MSQKMTKGEGFTKEQVLEAIRRSISDGAPALLITDSPMCGTGMVNILPREKTAEYLYILEQSEFFGLSETQTVILDRDSDEYNPFYISFEFLYDEDDDFIRAIWVWDVHLDPYYLFN